MADVRWQAVYKDNSVLDQYDDAGKGRSFNDINRTELKKFILYRNDEPAIVVNLSSTKRLIYRKRVAATMGRGEQVVYLVGWQQKVSRKNVQQINFLFEDGHVEVVDKFDKKHPWHYPVKFLPEERI